MMSKLVFTAVQNTSPPQGKIEGLIYRVVAKAFSRQLKNANEARSGQILTMQPSQASSIRLFLLNFLKNGLG